MVLTRLPEIPAEQITETLVPENAAKRVLVPTAAVNDAWKGGSAFDDSLWTAGTGGVGYETSSGYETYFGINVRQKMYNINATCYIRIPFTLSSTQLADIKSLTLKVRYDDGFVAYINGTEVKRALFTGTPAWNSQADSTHDDTVAVVFESFDISSYIGLLHQGENILAIHGLNRPANSSDFLISVELSRARAQPPLIQVVFRRPLLSTQGQSLSQRALTSNPESSTALHGVPLMRRYLQSGRWRRASVSAKSCTIRRKQTNSR